MMHGSRPHRKITTMIRRPEHYGEVGGEKGLTEITAATRPSSRNSLGELWWEFRKIRPAADGQMRLDAECRAVDVIQMYHRAEWTSEGGEPVAVGKFTNSGAHAVIRARPAGDDGGRGRVLHCQTGHGRALTGRFCLPARGPQRLYATVALPQANVPEATFSVGGARPVMSVTLDSGHRRATVVADLMGFSGDLVFSIRTAAEDATARIEIVEAWLVSIPAAEADLVATQPASASPGLSTEESVVLTDCLHYGPQVAQVRLGGAHQKTWTGEWRVKAPDASSMLHALAGLTKGCTPGARARLTITVSNGAHQWLPMRDLDLTVHADEDARRHPQRSNLPAVIEAALPNGLRGQNVTVRLDASTASDQPTVLAIPCLRICRQRPADD